MARIGAINILVFEIYGSLVHKLKQAPLLRLASCPCVLRFSPLLTATLLLHASPSLHLSMLTF
jgi:hypothetical protein